MNEEFLENDKLTELGKKRILEFSKSTNVPERFYCPECECSRDVELEISFGQASSDNGKIWEDIQSFYFRCPKCYFDLGGGTLLKEDVIRENQVSKK